MQKMRRIKRPLHERIKAVVECMRCKEWTQYSDIKNKLGMDYTIIKPILETLIEKKIVKRLTEKTEDTTSLGTFVLTEYGKNLLDDNGV